MWKRVAESIPGRNNKNCRKRWHSTLKCKNNGTWAPDEDERLINAVKTHGTLWVKVAKHVGTRISDQCAKRWTDYLDPSLTHEEWLAEEDSLLLKAVETHGRSWTLIVQSCLKGRAAISAKNR
ncbi:Homeodomain-like protein [Geranomyces variabilis]|nr:Homeodomain-like protein [Geranomyces variabilis]